MGLVIWLIALVAAAIGTILSFLLLDLVSINIDGLIYALVWFLIAYALYYAGRKIDGESWFKLLSVNFFLTWAFCTIGYIVGAIVWTLIDIGSTNINLDAMIGYFWIALPLTIGPTAAMSLGLRD